MSERPKSNPPNLYSAQLMRVLGVRDPYLVLEELAAALFKLIDGVPASAHTTPEGQGKWSMLGVLHHLADNELVYGYRIRMMLTHDQPSMPRYDRERWAERLGYEGGTMDDVIRELSVLRVRNLRLYRSLKLDDLMRKGTHETRGTETVAFQIRILAGHDLVHRAQLARIRDVLGFKSSGREGA